MTDFIKLSASLHKETSEPKVVSGALAKPWWLSRKMLSDLVMLYDIAAITISAWAAYYAYIAGYLDIRGDGSAYLALYVIGATLFHAAARHYKQYDYNNGFSFVSQISSLVYVCILTFGAVFVMVLILDIQSAAPGIWLILWITLFLSSLAFGRALLSRYLGTRAGLLKRSVALVGWGEQLNAAKAVLLKERHDLDLVKITDLSELDTVSSPLALSAGYLQSLIMEAQNRHIDSVVVALPSTMGAELDRIVQQLQILPVDVQVVPDFGSANIVLRQVHQIGGLSAVTAVSKPISERGALLKRAVDLAVGAMCLFLFLPAMVLIAIAIKLDSDGPVLFRQRRHGYNHKVIEVLKFRTMTVLEDGETVTQATRNDRRITRVGAILRRTSLDELPQFWNVLRGDMSLVGPRPHALAHNTYYGELIENYANRHRVKPGITGWAQVHGCRGETVDPAMMAKRVRYDLDYIENWSIWLDLKIIFMTPLFGFFRSTAY